MFLKGSHTQKSTVKFPKKKKKTQPKHRLLLFAYWTWEYECMFKWHCMYQWNSWGEKAVAWRRRKQAGNCFSEMWGSDKVQVGVLGHRERRHFAAFKWLPASWWFHCSSLHASCLCPAQWKAGALPPCSQRRDSPVATRLQWGPHHASGSAMGRGRAWSH